MKGTLINIKIMTFRKRILETDGLLTNEKGKFGQNPKDWNRKSGIVVPLYVACHTKL